MHIKVIKRNPKKCQIIDSKCRECQTPCKSAAKTANTIGNQVCELKKRETRWIL
ncbi:MAG TPA: six-cysteine ranthipeptide SCIFF [Caldisericia bacterium]|nr:six-cysteine ranthipeptide SCIFF [Caldisericia bacterium]HPF49381.1 six-cysteine ranthipeptide SCIFF [Caldisericia bacterium]HPI84457.1 six-cysteine ranthipeptide SCIFF [Caldisericia bacterium]HPQ93782.1 six-cysteine ranthipeptide SCIFF [Caldisericia bacterium]HRV75654.1 six-cysteine ranthipeptide SCIFF [Caldisericia bacterium]